MDKLRLLLRSVYLKGHQDGNFKTTDLSWEDKIVKEILSLLKDVVGKEEKIEPFKDSGEFLTMDRGGYQTATETEIYIQEYQRRIFPRVIRNKMRLEILEKIKGME